MSLNQGFWQDALACLRFLQEIGSSRADEFRARCDSDKRLVLATIFKTAEEISQLRAELATAMKETASMPAAGVQEKPEVVQ